MAADKAKKAMTPMAHLLKATKTVASSVPSSQ